MILLIFSEEWMKTLADLLCGYLTPIFLCFGGIALAVGIRLPRILRPDRFFAALTRRPADSDATPFMGLTAALAGTLGVGNITGVATAIISGGPGAVFWMQAGAILAMSVKYGEVVLAVKYRRRGKNGFYGGAMYYISDGLGRRFPGKSFVRLGGVFALLCIANSLVTGNIVQSNSAAEVVSFCPALLTGGFLAALTAVSVIWGVDRIGKITSRLIPLLSGLYIALSLYVVFSNLPLIPEICADIFRSAFSFRAAAGGATGIAAREALRYGVARGIFSNEAGCGSSPTAHASADAVSPFHQGCMGIFEVAADTLTLCSMTAFVLLTADKKYGFLAGATVDEGASLTLKAFASLTGDWAYWALAVSVVLFAYAAIFAQTYYGFIAVGYLTGRRLPRALYLAAAVCCPLIGAVVRADAMWLLADALMCVMTILNITVLLILRKEIYAAALSAGKELPARKP